MDLSAHRSALKFTSLTFVILLFFLGLSLAANVLAWLRIEDLARGQKETYIPMFFNQPFSLSRRCQLSAAEPPRESWRLNFLRKR